jgi:hypothetical protein
MSPWEISFPGLQIVDQFCVDLRAVASLFSDPLSVDAATGGLAKLAFSQAFGRIVPRKGLHESRILGYALTAFALENSSTLGASVMDDSMCRRFFLEPGQSAHRRYEALRAIFVEGLPLDQVADRFDYRPAALRSLVSRFRGGCRAGNPPPFSFATDPGDRLAGNRAKTRAVPNSPKSPTVAS